jgi:cellulose synthase (UDP-forming)
VQSDDLRVRATEVVRTGEPAAGEAVTAVTMPTGTLPAPLGATALTRAGIAGWAARLGAPGPEAPRSRRLAHAGGVAAITALVLYLVWRVMFTMPSGEWNLTIAWILVTFEALPLAGLILKAWSVWNIDSADGAGSVRGPPPRREASPGY